MEDLIRRVTAHLHTQHNNHHNEHKHHGCHRHSRPEEHRRQYALFEWDEVGHAEVVQMRPTILALAFDEDRIAAPLDFQKPTIPPRRPPTVFDHPERLIDF